MTDLEPAGILPRLYAWIVDRFLLGSLWLLLTCWGVVAYVGLARWPGDLKTLAALIGLLLLWGIALHAAYFIVFVGGCGQTPGKMLCGIAVVRRDGAPAGYWQAFLRWVGAWMAALPFWLGFLGVFFTAERRGLHDWIAGTRVIRRGHPRDPRFRVGTPRGYPAPLPIPPPKTIAPAGYPRSDPGNARAERATSPGTQPLWLGRALEAARASESEATP